MIKVVMIFISRFLRSLGIMDKSLNIGFRESVNILKLCVKFCDSMHFSGESVAFSRFPKGSMTLPKG